MWWFMFALLSGILVGFMMSSSSVVVQYPTPENAGKITYIDKSGVCYRYLAIPR